MATTKVIAASKSRAIKGQDKMADSETEQSTAELKSESSLAEKLNQGLESAEQVVANYYAVLKARAERAKGAKPSLPATPSEDKAL